MVEVVVAVCWKMAYKVVVVVLRMLMDVMVIVGWRMVEGVLVEREDLEGLLYMYNSRKTVAFQQ